MEEKVTKRKQYSKIVYRSRVNEVAKADMSRFDNVFSRIGQGIDKMLKVLSSNDGTNLEDWEQKFGGKK